MSQINPVYALPRKPDPDLTRESINEALRLRSGEVKDNNPLTCFFYTLIRDHLPAGTVEALVKEIELEKPKIPWLFSNGWLALYAKDLAQRLMASERKRSRGARGSRAGRVGARAGKRQR